MTTNKDLEYMQKELKKQIKRSFPPPEPDWEDKHPFLASLIIIFAFVFQPINLLIMGVIALIITLG